MNQDSYTLENQPVDPDPFTVASTFIAAAALVLQFLQMRQTSAAVTTNRANREKILDQLEAQVQNTLTKSERVVRSIERGTQNSDFEFFDSPYRVAASTLLLEKSHHSQFQTALSEQYAALANISLWINHTIHQDEALAARIGAHMASPLSETAAHINKILAEGRSNREAIEQGKIALRALQQAIEEELRQGN